jgi:branched-chain amino acid transport system substrate-binding protein
MISTRRDTKSTIYIYGNRLYRCVTLPIMSIIRISEGNEMNVRDGKTLRAIGAGVLALGLAVSMAACGGSSKKSGTGDTGSTTGLPSDIKILSTTDLTGAAAFAGIAQLKGAQLAVQEINDQKYLGTSKITLVSKDTAGNAQTAASQVTEGIADSATVGLLGTVSSAQTIAVAPIVQQGKLPTLFTQSGSPGTIVGNYTFRATAPFPSYYTIALDYLKTKNVKKIAIIYNSASPTLQETGEKVIPDNAKKYGYTVTSSTAVTGTTTDFSAAISKALADKPDVVSILLVGAANPTAATQLRQAGYSGLVLANPGASAGNLKPAGAAGSNWIWPTDFSTLQPAGDVGKKFITSYKTKYPTEVPLNYAAEGYDAMWMFARAIKAEGKADRVSIQAGLDKVAKEGYEGAVGKITYKDRDEVVTGILVGWDGAAQAEILIK